MSDDARPAKKSRKVMDKNVDDEAVALLRYLQDHGGRGGAASEEPIEPEKLPILVDWLSAPDDQIRKPVPLYTV
jgi:hypothetical protein